MKVNTKEVVWFFIPPITAFLIMIASFGTTVFTDRLTINIHDTYYVMPPWFLFLLQTTLIGLAVFAIRSTVLKFKNRGSNISLAIYTLLFICMLVWVMN